MFQVHELGRAQADIRSISGWLAERSPQGAKAWLRAYDELTERLEKQAPSFGPAHENDDCEFDVRQALFKTRRGGVYRALFFIEGQGHRPHEARRVTHCSVCCVVLVSSGRWTG